MSLFGTISDAISKAKNIVDDVEDRSGDWTEDMTAVSFGEEYAQLAATTNSAMTLADDAKKQAESNMASLRQAAETAQQQALAAQTQGQALQTLADSTLAQAQSNIATLEGTLTSQVNQQLTNATTQLETAIGSNFGELGPVITQITDTIKSDLNQAVQQIINEIKSN